MIFDEVTFKVIRYLSTNVAIAIANTTNQYSVKRPQVTRVTHKITLTATYPFRMVGDENNPFALNTTSPLSKDLRQHRFETKLVHRKVCAVEFVW